MDAREEKLQQSLDGFHELLVYLGRFNKILVEIKNGKNVDDIDFNRIYDKPKLEEINEVNNILTIVSKAIETILKIIYAPSTVLEKRWTNDLNKYRGRALTQLKKDEGGEQEIGYHAKEDLQLPYMNAISLYKEEIVNHPGLYKGLKEVPGKCPWDLDEILSTDIDSLKDILRECS